MEISKGPTQFMPRQFIETGINDIHKRIVASNYLQGTSPEAFAQQAGELIGDLNHAHPFREGNGRTQMQYLKQLAEKAGHPIDLTQIDTKDWIAASIRSNDADYGLMQDCIRGALSDQSRETDAAVPPKETDASVSAEKAYAKAYRQAQKRTQELQQNQEIDWD
ncbi:Fic/DOC family protein [Pseudaestuariivita rosea]|uniref:Fic/DOC family protein n=1 Tax=Pseudaestuariivita rosea TaxID=2763263 RepID=UPI001ABB7E07|nr:Fic family protein [Pseudaestuariivita rosea]